jgi:hypothetical protein
MAAKAQSIVVPILLITVGVGWLLSTLGVAPDINWVWTLGLGVVGVLVFAIYGVDKATVVVGTLFILTSILSVLRQSGRITLEVEVPVLVIAAGVLMMVSRHPRVPPPAWLLDSIPKGR